MLNEKFALLLSNLSNKSTIEIIFTRLMIRQDFSEELLEQEQSYLFYIELIQQKE
jgi:hypothetical protein